MREGFSGFSEVDGKGGLRPKTVAKNSYNLPLCALHLDVEDVRNVNM